MGEKKTSKNIRKCPWCNEMTASETRLLKKRWGDVRERRCTGCGKVLAAYLVEEGDFMSKIRAFPNQ